jgi:hypothetical protein
MCSTHIVLCFMFCLSWSCVWWCSTHIVLCFMFCLSWSCVWWCSTHIVLCFMFCLSSSCVWWCIKNGQSRETGKIGYTGHKTKTNRTKTDTICVGHHYNTNNVNKTWAILQTTGGKDEPNIVFTLVSTWVHIRFLLGSMWLFSFSVLCFLFCLNPSYVLYI